MKLILQIALALFIFFTISISGIYYYFTNVELFKTSAAAKENNSTLENYENMLALKMALLDEEALKTLSTVTVINDSICVDVKIFSENVEKNNKICAKKFTKKEVKDWPQASSKQNFISSNGPERFSTAYIFYSIPDSNYSKEGGSIILFIPSPDTAIKEKRTTEKNNNCT